MESLAARPVHRVLVQEVPDLPKEPVEMSERETVGQSDEWYTPPEVLDRAVEEGRESVRTGVHVNTTQGYQEQEFRAIAAAAYRQGREDGLREAREKAEAFLNSHKVYSADDLLRSLLTDKEGEQ